MALLVFLLLLTSNLPPKNKEVYAAASSIAESYAKNWSQDVKLDKDESFDFFRSTRLH